MQKTYDPEQWSILDPSEQAYLEEHVARIPYDMLSIQLIFDRSRAPWTPSRYAFILYALLARLTEKKMHRRK